MKKTKYIKYQRYELISIFLSVSVWVSLGTFCIVTKSNLSLDLITYMEAAIFITAILGIHIAFKKVGSYSLFILLNVITETMFLICILILTYYKSEYIALSIYAIIILSRLINPVVSEKARNIEDLHFKKNSEKQILANLRMKDGYIDNIAGVLGSLIAILAISILKIDIYTFAIYMLIINIIQNIFDYYKWFVFLKNNQKIV